MVHTFPDGLAGDFPGPEDEFFPGQSMSLFGLFQFESILCQRVILKVFKDGDHVLYPGTRILKGK